MNRFSLAGDFTACEDGAISTTLRSPPEMRDWAVQPVLGQ